jgi:acyl-CoA hydrolase
MLIVVLIIRVLFMPSSKVIFRFLAEPTDVNFGGKVHGGAVMKWIDQAGYACAAGWSGHYCVTVSVAGVKFRRPILAVSYTQIPAKKLAGIFLN